MHENKYTHHGDPPSPRWADGHIMTPASAYTAIHPLHSTTLYNTPQASIQIPVRSQAHLSQQHHQHQHHQHQPAASPAPASPAPAAVSEIQVVRGGRRETQVVREVGAAAKHKSSEVGAAKYKSSEVGAAKHKSSEVGAAKYKSSDVGAQAE
eukprot:2695920-Prymnesium_polylepis.4